MTFNGRSITYVLSSALLMMALVLTGCSSNQPAPRAADVQVDLVAELSKAAESLLTRTPIADRNKPVLATSFVNVDNLQQSSTFGRQASEIFGAALTRTGMPVIEVKMRDNMFIQEHTGELILSRELRHLSAAHNAQAVLVGTYAVGGTHLYVNVRMVRTNDSVILGAHNFSLPLNRDIRSMLPRN